MSSRARSYKRTAVYNIQRAAISREDPDNAKSGDRVCRREVFRLFRDSAYRAPRVVLFGARSRSNRIADRTRSRCNPVTQIPRRDLSRVPTYRVALPSSSSSGRSRFTTINFGRAGGSDRARRRRTYGAGLAWENRGRLQIFGIPESSRRARLIAAPTVSRKLLARASRAPSTIVETVRLAPLAR